MFLSFSTVDARLRVLVKAKDDIILLPGNVLRMVATAFEHGENIRIGHKISQNDIGLDEVVSQGESSRTTTLVHSSKSTQKSHHSKVNGSRSTQRTPHSKVNGSHTAKKTSHSKHRGRKTRIRHFRGRRNDDVKGIWTRYGFWEGGHKGRRPFDSLASSILGK